MTPLEKAKSNKGRVNYCDECEQFEIVGNAAYCKSDGKLIHPIMLVRGQGTGAAWNCKKRRKPMTNYDKIIIKTPEELASRMAYVQACGGCPQAIHDCRYDCYECWLDWLGKEADE